jgi:hypothetical protein
MEMAELWIVGTVKGQSQANTGWWFGDEGLLVQGCHGFGSV